MNNDSVIVIPYRNRKEHLDYFLKNSWPLIEKHCPDTLLLIVEQSPDDGKLFNRGKLLNIGFEFAKEKGIKNVITHDVDYNPYEETVKKYYSSYFENEITGICSPKSDTLGCIFKCPLDIMFKINGYPNEYWGWGVEDRALQNRAVFYKIKIVKNLRKGTPETQNAFKVFDDIDDRKKASDIVSRTNRDYNPELKLGEKEDILNDGISTLKYEIISKENILSKDNIIKITVKL